MIVRWCAVHKDKKGRASAFDEWQPLHPAPGDNRGFVETGRYTFAKPDDAGWVLRVDDEPLGDSSTHKSSWTWTPGFFAGEVTAELLRPDGRRTALFLLDVAPDPSKVGREIFARMMEELWHEDPTFVRGSEPATSAIGDQGLLQDPWLMFARLRRYAPAFLTSLAAVRARPRHALRARRDSAALHQARRVDRRTVQCALATPGLIRMLTQRAVAVSVTPDPQHRLDVPVVEETLDSAANRTMLALVLAVLRRARMLLDTLQDLVARERRSETRTSLAARWPARKEVLDTLITDLKAITRKSPFADVERVELTSAGLTAIAADPIYARAWGCGWRALRHGMESNPSTERLWVSPSWEIYERWCFVRLSTLLRKKLPDFAWTRRKDGRRWTGTHHRGGRVELRLQPTFPAHPRRSEDRWSVSRMRKPDLVLTFQHLDRLRFIVLDAKYRTSRRAVLDSMQSAHIYQDSLRIGATRPDASLLLVPSGGGAQWLEDGIFQTEHRVGVHGFSADSPHDLLTLVNLLLDSATRA